MNSDMHKCVDCDRMIPVHINRSLFCKDALRKRGMCVWCAERPAGEGTTKYCDVCKPLAAKAARESSSRLRYSPHGNYRPQEAKENTYETKHGTGHG